MAGAESVIRARVFDGMREFLAPFDVGLDPLLKNAGLNLTSTSDMNTPLPLSAVAQAFEAAAAKTKEPCFGIKYALAYPPGAGGPFGQLIVHAPTLRDAVAAFPKFAYGFISPNTFHYTEDKDEVGCLEWDVPVELVSASTQLLDFMAAVSMWRLRAIAGSDWQPLECDLTHRELPCAELAATVFGNNIRYDQPSMRVLIDGAALGRRAKFHDARLYDALIMASEADMTGVAAAGDIITRVRRKIHTHLTEGAPELDVIAANLRMQPRALQWQLSQAGTSFERVLSDTRRMIGESMLASSDLPLAQVALALGFNDQSSFNRACKAWFDMTPSAFRDKARNPDAPAKVPKTKPVRRAGQEPADD
jgi:AraC-like DNA-binding protein